MRAMSPRAGLSRTGPRWAWVLLLALLLPLAQAVAARHTITHHGPAQQRDGAPSALDAHCAQCLLAAPVGAGAPPSAPLVIAAPDAAQPAPPAPVVAEPASALALAYRSRAPPTALH
jgi:hypothetical protein